MDVQVPFRLYEEGVPPYVTYVSKDKVEAKKTSWDNKGIRYKQLSKEGLVQSSPANKRGRPPVLNPSKPVPKPVVNIVEKVSKIEEEQLMPYSPPIDMAAKADEIESAFFEPKKTGEKEIIENKSGETIICVTFEQAKQIIIEKLDADYWELRGRAEDKLKAIETIRELL